MKLFNYFELSKSEKNVILLLSIFILSMLIYNIFQDSIIKKNKIEFSKFENEISEFLIEQEKKEKEIIKKTKIKYFDFDPNIISFDKWLSLGVHPKTIRIILNYTSKGGVFYKKEDLKKIYSFSDKQYKKLAPYIKIKNKKKTYKKNFKEYKNFKKVEQKTEYKNKIKVTKKIVVELSTATQEELIKIHGIGKVFSKRIIKYRNLLGGYSSINQLNEVYGFSNEVFEKVKNNFVLKNLVLTKISINLANTKEFSKHPYIDYKTARKIIEFRDINGTFKNIDDLQNNNLIEKTKFVKLKPYLKLWND